MPKYDCVFCGGIGFHYQTWISDAGQVEEEKIDCTNCDGLGYVEER